MRTPLTTLSASEVKSNSTVVQPFDFYDLIVVSFSGGKDSMALLLALFDAGVPGKKIQLWHQDVDGQGKRFMDWPCTAYYCRAIAESFDVRILFQFREGGFLREMLRHDSKTAPTFFECRDGAVRSAGGVRGRIGTREKYPQVSMDLSVRWCSAALKIDVVSIALNNDPALKDAKILLLTGERREEGRVDKNGQPRGRAAYAEMERHRCSTKKRLVDQWRMVIDWNEAQVWRSMQQHGVMPHPAYRLGFGRVSCQTCIFGLPDQWASIRLIDPARFEEILYYERLFGCTIKEGGDVAHWADKGEPYPACRDDAVAKLALSEAYPGREARIDPFQWTAPAGAYKRCGGPA